jgi:hypothetical protein
MIDELELDRYHLLLLIEKLNQGLEIKITAFGKSMLPFIKPNDILILKKQKPKIGDVILFKNQNGDIFIHRCLWINQDGYYTKGDNLVRFDDFVAKQDVLAVVVEIFRSNRRLLNFRYLNVLGVLIFFLFKKTRNYFFQNN